MRLIDADKLRKRIKTEMNPYGAPTLDYQTGLRILQWIDNAPNSEIVRCEPKAKIIIYWPGC